MVAVDEEVTKDTLPIGMLFDQFTTYGYTQNIHVPVLNVIGDFDTLACQLPSCTGSGSIANEGSFYHPDADAKGGAGLRPFCPEQSNAEQPWQ